LPKTIRKAVEKGSGDPVGRQGGLRKRILALLESDTKLAKRILKEFGIEPRDLGRHLERVGLVYREKSEAFRAIRKKGHPVISAAQFLLLRTEFLSAEPSALQYGRIWGSLSKGMMLGEIAKSSHSYLLRKAQGKGGRPHSDLGSSLRAIVQRRPGIKVEELPGFFESDEGQDMLGARPQPLISIRDLELHADLLLFRDSAGIEQKVAVSAVRRLLQRVRRQAT